MRQRPPTVGRCYPPRRAAEFRHIGDWWSTLRDFHANCPRRPEWPSNTLSTRALLDLVGPSCHQCTDFRHRVAQNTDQSARRTVSRISLTVRLFSGSVAMGTHSHSVRGHLADLWRQFHSDLVGILQLPCNNSFRSERVGIVHKSLRHALPVLDSSQLQPRPQTVLLHVY